MTRAESPFTPVERRRLVIAMMRRQSNRCYLCDRHMVIMRGESNLPDHAATIDHVIPLAEHGGWGEENLALACHDCNRRKAAKVMPTKPKTIRKQERREAQLRRKFFAFQTMMRYGIPLRGGWL